MQPSRPTATIPTVAYQAALTARDNNGVVTAEDDIAAAEIETMYHQHLPGARVNRCRRADVDYLNVPNTRIGSAVRLGGEEVALARATTTRAHPCVGHCAGASLARDQVGPSHRDVPSHHPAVGPHLTINTIQHYLRRMAYSGGTPRSNQTTPSGSDARAANGAEGGVAGANQPLSNTAQPVARITLRTIRQYLRQKGYSTRCVTAESIQSRLASVNLSVAVLLIALQTVHSCNHPVLRALNVSAYEQEALIFRLSGIVINKSGFRQAIQTCVLGANNDPNRLISNILQLIRGSAV